MGHLGSDESGINLNGLDCLCFIIVLRISNFYYLLLKKVSEDFFKVVGGDGLLL